MREKPDYLSMIRPVAGLLVVLGAAWGLDAVMKFLQYVNAQTFSLPLVILWSYTLAGLCLAALLLLQFWFMLVKAPARAWVFMLYLLVGAFIVFYPSLYLTPGLAGWLPDLPAFAYSNTMYLFTAGGFVAITGLFGLILRRKERKVSPR